MKDRLVAFLMRAALFLLIANALMLLILPPRTAEWYVTILSFALMAVLLVGAFLARLVKKRK